MKKVHKRLSAFKSAFQGITNSIESEFHMKVHFIAAFITIGLAYYLNIDPYEWMAIIICIVMVIGVELINTAIEHAVDLFHPNQHPLAGKAKDAAAGAVLIIAIGALIIGLIIFIPKF